MMPLFCYYKCKTIVKEIKILLKDGFKMIKVIKEFNALN